MEWGSIRNWIRTAVRERCGIDARALGTFRILLGTVLLLDVLLRVQDLQAHYTDSGVLPRSALPQFLPDGAVTVHTVTGDVVGMALLFLLHAAVAVGLLIGYRTRIMTVAAWFLWMSIHRRIPVVLNGGDDLLRMLLFWAMFVPLGARFSVDAQRRDSRGDRIVTLGTTVLLLQVVIMYLANAVMKHAGTVWPRGDGLAYVMRLDRFTTPAADLLAQFPELMTVMSLTVLALWTAAPFLMLLTGWRRALLATMFISVHVGIGLTMHLGLFPLITIAALLLFYPGSVWDRLLPPERIERLHPPVDILRQVPQVAWDDVTAPDGLRRGLRYAAGAVIVIVLCYVLLWNVEFVLDKAGADTEVVPDGLEQVGEATYATQYWNMFAPNPLQDDGWYVIPGTLANGSQVDVYDGGGPVSYAKPADVSATYPNQRWRKYLMNLWDRDYDDYRPYYADYLCDRWNTQNTVALTNLSIDYVLEKTVQNGESPPEPTTIHTHRCAAG